MATSSEQDGAGAAPQINRQQFSLPELPTSSVTIYPARATVVRNIKGISLKVHCRFRCYAQLDMIATINSHDCERGCDGNANEMFGPMSGW